MAVGDALNAVPYLFLILVVAGIVAGVGVLSVGKFGDQMTQCTTVPASMHYNGSTALVYNSTMKACVNSTDPGRVWANITVEYQAILDSKTGLGDVAEQFPTLGIIAIMVIIIALISSVFVYFQYMR